MVANALFYAGEGAMPRVRIVAIAQPPTAMETCPHMARKFFSVLLRSIAPGVSNDASVAKQQLDKALAARPDIAIDDLDTLMGYMHAKSRRMARGCPKMDSLFI